MPKKVEMYSTPTCHFCQMTKEFFNEKGVEYTNYDVSTDAGKRQEMIEKTGQLGVPVIVVDDNILIGFNKDKLANLLGIAA